MANLKILPSIVSELGYSLQLHSCDSGHIRETNTEQK